MDFEEQPSVDPADLVIIITTSPIPSNPATEVIDMAISSISKEPTLGRTPIYIICDGVKVAEEGGSKYKSGIVSPLSEQHYAEFKQRLKEKYQHNHLITIEQRVERKGFAENIRYVMSKVPHEFVMIFQHDHILMRKCDFRTIVNTMKTHPINYIGLMNKSVSKLPFELDQHLGMRKYFCDKLDYHPTNVRHDHQEFTRKVEQWYRDLYGIPLMPLLFWYDKVHIARKSYYMDVIFNPHGFFDEQSNSYVKTVSFVEDSFGCFMRRNIHKRPPKIEELSAFIYWDSKESMITHSHGRGFLTRQEKDEIHQNNLKNKEINGEQSSSQQEMEEVELDLGFMQEQSQQ